MINLKSLFPNNLLSNPKKKIVILGVNSFIGSNLVKFFKKNNVNFVGFYNNKKTRLKGIKNIRKLDLNNNSLTKFINNFQPDTIINFIGNSNNNDNNLKNHVSSNINSLTKILLKLQNAKYKKYTLYGCSTSLEFPSSKNKILEISKRVPSSIYALTKFISHIMYLDWSLQNKVKYTNLIFYNIVGDDFYKKDIISKMIDNFEEEIIIKYPKTIRDFTYINDIVKILYLIFLKNNISHYPSINICSGRGHSIIKLYNLIKKHQIINLRNIKLRKNNKYEKTVGNNNKLLKIIGKFKFTKIEDVIKYKIKSKY